MLTDDSYDNLVKNYRVKKNKNQMCIDESVTIRSITYIWKIDGVNFHFMSTYICYG